MRVMVRRRPRRGADRAGGRARAGPCPAAGDELERDHQRTGARGWLGSPFAALLPGVVTSGRRRCGGCIIQGIRSRSRPLTTAAAVSAAPAAVSAADAAARSEGIRGSSQPASSPPRAASTPASAPPWRCSIYRHRCATAPRKAATSSRPPSIAPLNYRPPSCRPGAALDLASARLRGDPDPPLQLSRRRGILRPDLALHSLPWPPPSTRPRPGPRRGVPHAAGDRPARQRLDAEPGSRRHHLHSTPTMSRPPPVGWPFPTPWTASIRMPAGNGPGQMSSPRGTLIETGRQLSPGGITARGAGGRPRRRSLEARELPPCITPCHAPA